MADKKFVQLVGTVGRDKPQERKNGSLVAFSLAVPTGYGDENKDQWFDIAAWENTKDGRGDFRQFVMKNINPGSKGVFVEGLMEEKPGNNGKVFRNVNVSRIGLVEYGERNTAFDGGADDDDSY